MAKVLIVDDDAFQIEFLTRILQDEYEILCTRSGPEALEIAAREKPSLILLDVIMPLMDGFEVLHALKDSDETRRIPVILLTSMDDYDMEEQGLLLGAMDYIRKPYKERIVRARVRNQVRLYENQCLIESELALDSLTGVCNRRDFQQRRRELWERAKAEGVPLSFMIFDIDYFKRVNDTYGHMTGDMVLTALSKVFKDTVSDSADGYIARYGGEEFARFLYNAPAEDGAALAEKIRTGVKALGLPNEYSDVCPVVTISGGGTTLIPDDADDLDAFLAQADSNLYSAKEAGRDRIVWND